MIKRTLFFGNPYALSTKNNQLLIKDKEKGTEISQPIEDIGYIVLDHHQIYVSVPAIQKLTENNVAIIYCDDKHLPSSMLMPLRGNTLQTLRHDVQIKLTEPQKKSLWKQVVIAKIRNQALTLQAHGQLFAPMKRWQSLVKSGDTTNCEAQAARYYWQHIFTPNLVIFRRDRYGEAPNNLLNYGYAILRAATARALVGSGLLCTLGIHHHNRYNPFCLADDIMEPFRPFVDQVVLDIINKDGIPEEITTQHKAQLLSVLTINTMTLKGKSPLMIALQRSVAQLYQAMEGNIKKIDFPYPII